MVDKIIFPVILRAPIIKEEEKLVIVVSNADALLAGLALVLLSVPVVLLAAYFKRGKKVSELQKKNLILEKDLSVARFEEKIINDRSVVAAVCLLKEGGITSKSIVDKMSGFSNAPEAEEDLRKYANKIFFNNNLAASLLSIVREAERNADYQTEILRGKKGHLKDLHNYGVKDLKGLTELGDWAMKNYPYADYTGSDEENVEENKKEQEE